MKKIIAIIMVIALSAVLLVGCGGNEGGMGDTSGGATVNSTSGSGNAAYTAATELFESDKTLLIDSRYTVQGYKGKNNANYVADDIGAAQNTLAAYLDAWENDDGHKMTVYYFVNESDAISCMSGKSSDYKRVGIRIVYNDTKNIIK